LSFLGGHLVADGTLEPRLELSQYLLVVRTDCRSGRAAAERARASRFSIRSSRIFSERASAEADLLTSCLMTASRLVILRRRPFSVTVTVSLSASFSKVVRFFEPGGRPLGCRIGLS